MRSVAVARHLPDCFLLLLRRRNSSHWACRSDLVTCVSRHCQPPSRLHAIYCIHSQVKSRRSGAGVQLAGRVMTWGGKS